MNARIVATRTAGLFICAALALAGVALPAVASELYVVHEDRPIDDSLRPAEGKALIYFVRSQIMGGAVKVKLYADGKFLGFVMSRTYIAHECDPGKHEFIAAAENAGFLEAEVQAGRIYYVQVAIHTGAFKARTHFETARKGSEALTEITDVKAKLRSITPTEEGLKWEAERAEKFAKTVKSFRDMGKEFEHLKPEDGYAEPPWKG